MTASRAVLQLGAHSGCAENDPVEAGHGGPPLEKAATAVCGVKHWKPDRSIQGSAKGKHMHAASVGAASC